MKHISFIIFLFLGIYGQVISQCSYNITASILYEDSLATGDFRIFPRINQFCGLNNLDKPIIFVETYDFLNQQSALDIHNTLNQSIDGSAFRPIDLLRFNGYDIITLNFDNANEHIQSNAFLLTELINQVNANKISDEELIIVGYGMGGLVARYALAYMEENNMAHETGLYVSLDAPHKGLNFPIGIQLFVNNFLSNPLVAPVSDDLLQFGTIVNSPAFKQMVPYQLPLPTATSPHEVEIAETYTMFYEELRGLNNCNGYPVQSRNVAASLGSWNQQTQQFNNSFAPWGSPQYAGFPNLYVNNMCILPDTIDHQSIIQFAVGSMFSTQYPSYNIDSISHYNLNTYMGWGAFGIMGQPLLTLTGNVFIGFQDAPPIDIAPGSTFPFYQLAESIVATFSGVYCTALFADDATFIPTISALDFDTEDLFYDIEADADKLLKTPFDDIFGITGDNLSHVEGEIFNLDLLTWLNNQFTTFSDASCAFGDFIIDSEVINEDELFNESLTLTISDVTVESSNNVDFHASETVKVTANTKFKANSNCILSIKDCTPKVCLYEPVYAMLAPPQSGSLASADSPIKPIEDNLNKNLNQDIFMIYPNPTTNQITIESPQSYSLEIFNMMGQNIGQQQEQAGNLQYDMTRFKAGIYIFQFRFEDGSTETVRVVKQ